jgi:Sulfatase
MHHPGGVRSGHPCPRHRQNRQLSMDRLAGNVLTYSQWHTTALCGPTRSCFLTGRNHHQNSFATIAETASGFPGNNTHIPMENAFQAEVMRENGWATYWVGKKPQRPRRRVRHGLLETQLAARPRVRSLLRVHRRGDEQLVSEPRRGQPLHRSALHARGGVSPLQGLDRPGAGDDPHRQGQPARQAVVHVLLPGRQPHSASRPPGVHRQVQGHVRRRL